MTQRDEQLIAQGERRFEHLSGLINTVQREYGLAIGPNWRVLIPEIWEIPLRRYVAHRARVPVEETREQQIRMFGVGVEPNGHAEQAYVYVRLGGDDHWFVATNQGSAVEVSTGPERTGGDVSEGVQLVRQAWRMLDRLPPAFRQAMQEAEALCFLASPHALNALREGNHVYFQRPGTWQLTEIPVLEYDEVGSDGLRLYVDVRHLPATAAAPGGGACAPGAPEGEAPRRRVRLVARAVR